MWCSTCWCWTGGARLQARLTAAKPSAAGLARCGTCRDAPAGLADPDAAYRNFFASVVGRLKDRGQTIRFTANARFKVLTSGEATPAQDRGRAGALVAPAAL